ncbi:MAG: hypothetical protein COA79_15010 [Planctomycetota bacterium]|nr:MAG: hypothetical protein COA79_15010 [Planctomycetota bacterium]
MDGAVTTVDHLLSGQVHGINDLESLRIDHIQSGETMQNLLNSVEKIDQSSLSDDLKNENKAYVSWMVGQYQSVVEDLEGNDVSSLASTVLSHCYLTSSKYEKSVEYMKDVYDGSDPMQALLYVDALLGVENVEKANEIYTKAKETFGENVHVLYCEARILEFNHEHEAAITIFERLVENFSRFYLASFRLANLYDLYNENEKAISLYLSCIPYGYVPTKTLVNLGLLFEDDDHYSKAIICFQKALESEPTNSVIRLHLSNSLGSQNMIFDEKKDQEKKDTEKILSVPVSDFELSVRSRNCLSKMNILTLGDLVNRTEEDLLSYKNFGETSLKEIKEMLLQRQLSLKSSKEDGRDVFAPMLPSQDPAALASPATAIIGGISIDSIQISLRSKKCLERLGIRDLEEITRFSKEDLMAIRNFGQTSLDEIAILLEQHNLSLKP